MFIFLYKIVFSLISQLNRIFKNQQFLIISSLLTVIIGLCCLVFIINSIIFSNLNFSLDYSFYYKLNTSGIALWYSGFIVGILVLLMSDSRLFFYKNVFGGGMIFFLYVIWLFINETNILNLFFYYELFLLPSFFLVYYLSPNRRSTIASIYFLTWTQFGSLLVLCAIMWLYIEHGSLTLELTYFSHTGISLLLFLGFGIKVPMWPFYYWLTKTHVEASSFFSIYLSGFLVKTAVYLFLKFYSVLGMSGFNNLFLVLFIIGVIDASIKMWHQVDLKKLIAFTTVQEMNFLMIPVLWNELFGELIISLFIITHCILSSLFFFYIDVISKRYNTRASSQITGLVHVMPTFSFFIFLSWVGFAGLPFTIKFTLELCIFSYLLNYNIFLFSITLVGMNVIGLIGFSKSIFNTLFGSPVILDYIVHDLTKRECFIFTILLLHLILLSIFTVFCL